MPAWGRALRVTILFIVPDSSAPRRDERKLQDKSKESGRAVSFDLNDTSKVWPRLRAAALSIEWFWDPILFEWLEVGAGGMRTGACVRPGTCSRWVYRR